MRKFVVNTIGIFCSWISFKFFLHIKFMFNKIMNKSLSFVQEIAKHLRPQSHFLDINYDEISLFFFIFFWQFFKLKKEFTQFPIFLIKRLSIPNHPNWHRPSTVLSRNFHHGNCWVPRNWCLLWNTSVKRKPNKKNTHVNLEILNIGEFRSEVLLSSINF